ncbi:hypothetical protein SAY86_021782 [Trapa natans]|uniref:DUF4378 domain-containing protein n=1 Tax=Trapa natans TaxID=22666 RepID=A0AAN7MT06_TRANT|nr:hypothetical protein SAY86_021782 [Trapa natans]
MGLQGLQMKKHARNKGCMSGILHTLYHYQWLNVKKRLPYRWHGRGRNPTESGIGCQAQISDPLKEQGNSQDQKSAVKQKKQGSLSVKARLKALVSEDKSWRKGQHQRSSTSPAHLHTVPIQQSHQSHQSKPCEKESDDPVSLNDETSPGRISNATSPCKGREDHSEVSSQQKPFRRAFSAGFPVHGSEFLGALERDELLQKIMHDRSKFLPERLYSQKQLCTKIRPRRSGTMKEGRDHEAAPTPSNPKNKGENSSARKAVDLKEGDHEEGDANSGVTFTPLPLPQLKDTPSENSSAIRRLRDIKHKIKHVIRTNQKEKQRIVMDGVIDKIPNDKRVSKEKKEELMNKWRECAINRDCRCSTLGREENYKYRKGDSKRISSWDDNSMDRYCQLFETSFCKEAKHHIPDRLKIRGDDEACLEAGRDKRSLARILSLPDMRSSSFQSADSGSETISLEAPSRADPTGDFSRGSSFDSTNCMDSQNQLQVDAVLEYDHTEEKPTEETESAAVEKSCLAEASLLEGEIGPVEKSSMEMSQVSTFNDNSQEIMPSSHESLSGSQDPNTDDLMGPGEKIDLEESELQEDEPLDDFQQSQLGAEDAELFNFVRDILEVSGLTGSEAFEAWNSSNQPVSLSVYEEVEGCLLMDPECTQNEDAGDDDHLQLLDLINEILVEMYQQSLSYCPVPLSRHCHIHGMPVGQHLLKEVWASMTNYLDIGPEFDPTLDYVVSKDLEKPSGWMDLQFESECIGLELEELIFDDLFYELMKLMVCLYKQSKK